MEKIYRICGKAIKISAPMFPKEDFYGQLFEAEDGVADISITCRISEPFPEMPKGTITKAGEFLVSVSGDTVYRALPMGTVHGALTRYNPSDTSFSETFFAENSFPVMMDHRYIWSSISLAQLLLGKNVFFIHASYIDIGNKAILFSAPSGTGKSTQADLWKNFRGAEIINGDKAGILTEENVYACGVPFCGTSGICKNKNLPLGAIILLSKSKTNSVRHLTGIEALQRVLQNVYLDLIAPDERKTIVDLLLKMLETVPVYALSCTADETAVITLEKALKNGGVI